MRLVRQATSAGSRLDDELGVEPSEPARALYLRILDQDPALTRARAAGGNLPRRVTSFVGREAELDGLVGAMRDNALVTALRHYEGELAAARIQGDPIRLVWTLYYLAVCHAVARVPEEGLAAAEESLAVAERTGNPTARSMGQYALGLVQGTPADTATATLGAVLDEGPATSDPAGGTQWERRPSRDYG